MIHHKLQQLEKDLHALLVKKCQAFGSSLDDVVCTAKHLNELEREALERIQYDLEHMKRDLSVPNATPSNNVFRLAKLMIKTLQLRRTVETRDIAAAVMARDSTTSIRADDSDSDLDDLKETFDHFNPWNQSSPFYESSGDYDRR